MVDEDLKKQMLFEQNEKSKGVAYLLWLFLGWLGVHRMYAGKTKSGIAQMLLSFTVVGFVLVTLWWWIIDAFLIPGMINERNLKTIDMIYGPEKKGGAAPGEPGQIPTELDAKRQAMLEDLRATGYKKERRDSFSELYR
ncbi:TM2 domain-containing protein [Erythrobacter aurantius]|uniref:TM2 domain-containing protein n=1 Tax=Erythrobacter aurantius TaxID=2909249 RepID=UPI00207A344B|nr:TM2 domain-containing protein [Erythrobacter aurantius]